MRLKPQKSVPACNLVENKMKNISHSSHLFDQMERRDNRRGHGEEFTPNLSSELPISSKGEKGLRQQAGRQSSPDWLSLSIQWSALFGPLESEPVLSSIPQNMGDYIRMKGIWYLPLTSIRVHFHTPDSIRQKELSFYPVLLCLSREPVAYFILVERMCVQDNFCALRTFGRINLEVRHPRWWVSFCHQSLTRKPDSVPTPSWTQNSTSHKIIFY